MSATPLRVVLAEDEVLLRRGVELMLTDAGVEVACAVGNAEELRCAVKQHAPDVVLTDIRMPPTFTDEGLVAAVELRKEYPGLGIVVLSQYVQRSSAFELLGSNSHVPGTGGASSRAGGTGYMLKQRIADIATFLEDLREVALGGTVIDPEVIQVMVQRAQLGEGGVATLTQRQREVLALVAEGRSNQAISKRLFISEKAVVQHTSRIYDALGLPAASDSHRRVLAVLEYLNR